MPFLSPNTPMNETHVSVTKAQAQAVADAIQHMEQARQELERLVSVLVLGHVKPGTAFAGVDVDAAVLRFTVSEPVGKWDDAP